jgi:hypothetical protein
MSPVLHGHLHRLGAPATMRLGSEIAASSKLIKTREEFVTTAAWLTADQVPPFPQTFAASSLADLVSGR